MSETKQGLSRLALEAGLGVRIWNSYSYLAARYFHYIIAAFVVAILTFVLLPHVPLKLMILILGIYTAYFLIGKLILKHFEEAFYHPRWQLSRGVIGVIVVFLLMWLLPLGEYVFQLWILFILPLIIISRHCATRVYIFGLVIAGILYGLVWSKIYLYAPEEAIPFNVLLANLTILILIAFLFHYLMRNIDARDTIITSFGAIEALSERAKRNYQPSERWRMVLETYLNTLQGVCGDIWHCDHNTRRVERLNEFRHCRAEYCNLNSPGCERGLVNLTDDHPVAQVARTGEPLYCISSAANVELTKYDPNTVVTWQLPDGIFARIVVPVLENEPHQNQTLGVLCIDFEHNQSPRPYLVQDYFEFIAGLARRVRPILHHVQQINGLRVLQRLGHKVVSNLTLDEVVQDAANALVDTLGFELATISLVDTETRQIKTVTGRGVPNEWINAASHSLDSKDIQAHIVRVGQLEVLTGWDDRFDHKLWNQFNHNQMVRVFMPINGRNTQGEQKVLGTIEAGYHLDTRTTIPNEQLQQLQIFARRLYTAIENAQLFSETQEWANILARLHQIGWQVALNHNLNSVLNEIVSGLHDVLGADIVMLYRYNREARQLEQPYTYGEIYDEAEHPLRLPSPDKGIVAAVLDSRVPYYSPHAQVDELLMGTPQRRKQKRGFTERQKVLSFAGVPMIVGGLTVGVLCINYRRRHTFSENHQQALEIAAQFAAAAILNAEAHELSEEVISSQERMRLATRLHNSLPQYLPAIRFMAETAGNYINGHPHETCLQVHSTLAQIIQAVDSAMKEVRINIFELNAKSGRNGHIGETLQAYAREISDYFNLEVQVNVLPEAAMQVPPHIGRELLLVCREAVANTAKYARATRLELALSVTETEARLVITDDGCGFDPQPVFTSCVRRGLTMMKDHIEKLGGAFQIDSAPNQGTTVSAQVPLSPNGAKNDTTKQ